MKPETKTNNTSNHDRNDPYDVIEDQHKTTSQGFPRNANGQTPESTKRHAAQELKNVYAYGKEKCLEPFNSSTSSRQLTVFYGPFLVSWAWVDVVISGNFFAG